jgi:hypothetical protein
VTEFCFLFYLKKAEMVDSSPGSQGDMGASLAANTVRCQKSQTRTKWQLFKAGVARLAAHRLVPARQADEN